MNKSLLLEKVNLYIKEKSLFLPENKLLLAVSGGIDSMVLWHILKTLNYTFAIAHCNFQLRSEESENENMFVHNKANEDNLVFYSTRFDTISYANENKLSIQEAARNLRYEYFFALCQKYNYDFIVTAHHLDDRIETMFINLLRGTGLRGLTAIPIKNNLIVRPMLFATRNEIVEYAKENNIKWCEDSSNKEDKYLRNKIRHNLIPLLIQLKNDFYHIQSDNFTRWEQEMQLIEEYLESEIILYIEKKEEVFVIKKSPFLNNERLQNLLVYYLKKFGFLEKQVYNLFNNTIQTGKYIHSQKYVVMIDRDTWILKPVDENTSLNYEVCVDKTVSEINTPIKLKFSILDKVNINSLSSVPTIACIDYEKLTFPLTIRKWEKGDFFIPLGMKGKKKISDFLKDIKIQVNKKNDVYVLTNKNDIVWVIGYRLDERYKLTNSTKNIYMVELFE